MFLKNGSSIKSVANLSHPGKMSENGNLTMDILYSNPGLTYANPTMIYNYRGYIYNLFQLYAD